MSSCDITTADLDINHISSCRTHSSRTPTTNWCIRAPSPGPGAPRPCTSHDAWETFKCAIHEAAYKILGKHHAPKKPWISESTLNIIEDRRAARLRGDKLEVKRLTRERNHALGLDQGRYWDAKAAAIESAVASQDQHTVFRKLRTCKLGLNNQSTTVQAEDGTRLTNIKDCLRRWKDPIHEMQQTSNSSVMLNKQYLH